MMLGTTLGKREDVRADGCLGVCVGGELGQNLPGAPKAATHKNPPHPGLDTP